MSNRESKEVRKVADLFTLLKMVTGNALHGIHPDGPRIIFTSHSVFVPNKPGLTKISHEDAFMNDELMEAMLECEWIPPVNHAWRPSPLLQLAYEGLDEEEAEACLQDDLGCEGVVHAPEADEVPPPGGLLL